MFNFWYSLYPTVEKLLINQMFFLSAIRLFTTSISKKTSEEYFQRIEKTKQSQQFIEQWNIKPVFVNFSLQEAGSSGHSSKNNRLKETEVFDELTKDLKRICMEETSNSTHYPTQKARTSPTRKDEKTIKHFTQQGYSFVLTSWRIE